MPLQDNAKKFDIRPQSGDPEPGDQVYSSSRGGWYPHQPKTGEQK